MNLALATSLDLSSALVAQTTGPARTGANLGSELVRWAKANGLVVPLMIGAGIVLIGLIVFVLKFKQFSED